MVYSPSAPKTVENTSISAPSHIDQRHWDEWIKSGVSEQIISLNVWSEYDPREIDKVLNRNNKSKWKHSENLIPAWCVAGVDPQTGERIYSGAQVKPDTSPLDKDGKPQKYLNAKGVNVAPLFLNTGNSEHWKEVIQDKTIPVFIGEGAKKAGACLSIGLAMISIPGVTTCRKKGRLHESLDLFTGFGRKFYLGFDNDVLTKRPVQNALLGLARELSATGSKVMVIQLPPGEAKGVDDYITTHGEEAFKELVSEAKTIEEWRDELKEIWQSQVEEMKSSRRSKLARYMELVRLGWGHELKYNQLKTCVELGDAPLDLNQVRLKIALEFDLDIPMQDAQTIVETIANENALHPVADYLDDLSRQFPNPDLTYLDNLATRYFGTDDPLHNIYLKKTLIAAVARIKKPGCKHDTSTILVGKQGAMKSTFWRTLFSDEWFTDELGDANEKDELMKLHRFWCLEWSEFETVYKRKDISSLKKFMTSTIDAFRTPYSRTVKEYPRRCILVGTTNEKEILSDPTGSRRFWIIPVTGYIPVEKLEEERDRIWATAYALYKSGEKWWLSAEEAALQEDRNEDFQTQDPWETAIGDYVQNKDAVTTTDIFNHLQIDPAKQDVGLSKRVAAILRRFGWEKVRKWISGAWVRLWSKTKNQKVENLRGSSGSSGSCVEEVTNDMYQKNSDFLVDRSVVETQQELQTTDEKFDPLDPLPNPNFLNFENQQVDSPQSTTPETENLVPVKRVEEGKVYFSRSLNKKVKVVKIFTSSKKADVNIAGDPFSKPRIAFNDLLEENWSPTVGQPAMYGNDLVTVVGFNGRGREYQIQFFSSKHMEYVKADKLSRAND